MDAGDSVRLSRTKSLFEKTSDWNWTPAVYTVDKHVVADTHPLYYINDHKGEKLKGKFYPSELQCIVTLSTESTYKIERVVRTRKHHGKTQYLVKWRGYPDSDNSWLTEDQMVQL